jgi:hypothetical protein
LQREVSRIPEQVENKVVSVDFGSAIITEIYFQRTEFGDFRFLQLSVAQRSISQPPGSLLVTTLRRHINLVQRDDALCLGFGWDRTRQLRFAKRRFGLQTKPCGSGRCK